MKSRKLKNITRERRKARNRAKIIGSGSKPRLSVFRSNKYLYAQLIDDLNQKTLLSSSTRNLSKKGNKAEQARILGEQLATKAKEIGISEAVLNKGSYAYHGRVQALTEGARAKGLKI